MMAGSLSQRSKSEEIRREKRAKVQAKPFGGSSHEFTILRPPQVSGFEGPQGPQGAKIAIIDHGQVFFLINLEQRASSESSFSVLIHLQEDGQGIPLY